MSIPPLIGRFRSVHKWYKNVLERINLLQNCLNCVPLPMLRYDSSLHDYIQRNCPVGKRYLFDLNQKFRNYTIRQASEALELWIQRKNHVLRNAQCTVVENPYAPFSPSLESDSTPLSVRNYNTHFRNLDADPRPFLFMNEFGIVNTNRESALLEIQESIKNELLSPNADSEKIVLHLFEKYGRSLYAISSNLFSWNQETLAFEREETIPWWQVVGPLLPSQIYFYRTDKLFRDRDIEIAMRNSSKIEDYITEKPLPNLSILIDLFPQEICDALNLPYAKMYSTTYEDDSSEYTNLNLNTQSMTKLDRRTDGSKLSTKKIADEKSLFVKDGNLVAYLDGEKEIGTPTSSFTTGDTSETTQDTTGETSETTQDTTDLQDDTLKDPIKTPWYKTSLGIASLVLGVSALGFGAFHLMRKQKTTL